MVSPILDAPVTTHREGSTARGRRGEPAGPHRSYAGGRGPSYAEGGGAGSGCGTGVAGAPWRGPPDQPREASVSEHIYRVTEIVGSSPDGVDAAIRNAIERASRTLRQLDWFEVVQVRGHIEDGELAHYQVGLKVGFRLEDTGT